jgi:hypothetical protein
LKALIFNVGRILLPRFIKNRLHNVRIIDRNLLNAKESAEGSKRLDLCASQIALILHLAGMAGKYPIKNKVCLEIGSGWVLSHALIFYLLGAKKVIATDIDNVAHPETLITSINKSVQYIIRDVLSPFEDHDIIRERLKNLQKFKSISFNDLKELGIEYHAPVDLAINTLPIKFDFIYSGSVLEHVPVKDALPLLDNLSLMLSEKGVMLHCIHLEDHNDSNNNPFEFYEIDEENYSIAMQSERGNRIRKSQWVEIFSNIKNIEYQILYEWSRSEKNFSSKISPSIIFTDNKDIKVSHLGVFAQKK